MNATEAIALVRELQSWLPRYPASIRAGFEDELRMLTSLFAREPEAASEGLLALAERMRSTPQAVTVVDVEVGPAEMEEEPPRRRRHAAVEPELHVTPGGGMVGFWLVLGGLFVGAAGLVLAGRLR